ncbi:hypothetical protein GCM10028809_58730 [Spirosoma gilvum]
MITMNKIVYGLFLVGILSACSGDGDLTISVTDSYDEYEFFAKYDKAKSQRVQDFINAKMAPATSVKGDHIDISTKLDDNTEFKLEEYEGKLRIKLDKEANSEASYHRIKSMCEGVKRIIQDK